MRKIVVYELLSLDGVAEDPDSFFADWPGYFPNGPRIARLLIGAGADPNALTTSRSSDK